MSKKLEAFFNDLGLSGTKLAHFGVRGMKWGVRRSDSQLSRSSGDADSADAVRARTTLAAIKSNKSLATASDADLQHLVNRISLEKRYSEITSTPSSSSTSSTLTSKKSTTRTILSKVNPHKNIKTLLDVGTTMNRAIEFSKSPAGKMIKAKLRS